MLSQTAGHALTSCANRSPSVTLKTVSVYLKTFLRYLGKGGIHKSRFEKYIC